LFRKSNPPLMEWLGSPIIYMDKYSIRSSLREMGKNYYSPLTCFHHYLGTARNHYREATQGEGIKIKSYFYTLRALLATHWVEAGYGGVIPTEFEILLERMVTSSAMKAEIQELLIFKKTGAEKDHKPYLPGISEYIEAELARLENTQIPFENKIAPFETLDSFFQNVLAEVWGNK